MRNELNHRTLAVVVVILPALFIAYAALFAPAASAQRSSLDHTVTVSNRYVGTLSETEMAVQPTVIPDSLLQFDLNFDYTGFEQPYKGSDFFNPIHTELDMQTRAYDGKRFDMTFGAGYAVPILLDLSAVLKQKGRFKIGVSALNKSFWGMYRTFDKVDGEVLPYNDRNIPGYDSRSKVAFDGRLDWERSHLLLNVGYDGLHSSLSEFGSFGNYNGAFAGLKYRYRSDKAFRMGVDFDYNFGYCNQDKTSSDADLMENVYKAALDFQFALGNGHLLELDADFNMTDCFNANPSSAGGSFCGYNIGLSPMYYFSGSDKLYFGIGVSLLYSGSVANVDRGANALTGFPFLKFRWKAVGDCLVFYADSHLDGEVWGVGSGYRANTFYVADENKCIVKNYKADVGLGGSLAGKFVYDLKACYSNVQNAPLFKIGSMEPYQVHSTSIVHAANLRSVDAAGKIMLNFGGFSLKADALYHWFFEKANMEIVPSELEISGDVRYNHKGRFYIHAGALYRSSYKSCGMTLPGYVDLKAGLGFNFRRSFGVFLEGSNLLGSSCWTVPLYSHVGQEVMLGIKLLY